ncbi:hypothetical protein CR513_36020, partial [Mucuna pruriens]
MNTNPLPAHGGQSINTLSHETPLIIQALARPRYKDNHVMPWQYGPMIKDPPAEPKDDNPAGEVTNIAGPRGMTRSGRICTLENLGKKNQTPKKSIKSPKDIPKGKEAEEFLKLIRHSEYELLDQMNKTPAHITVERFGGIVNNITSRGRVTFSEEEVPTEGRRHNQPLHISVKCGYYMIARVLIDNGSSLNVLPKSTPDKLCSINSQLRASSVVVRAFDNSKRDVMGEITLLVYVGPTLFDIVFQVMDICPAYSCLLGRPWIHMVGAVPSSLHQRVKFIADHQLVSVMGEELSLEFAATPSPGSKNPAPPFVAKGMAFRVMIKEGYQPGKGLGPHLNGISAPIEMRENTGKAGLG